MRRHIGFILGIALVSLSAEAAPTAGRLEAPTLQAPTIQTSTLQAPAAPAPKFPPGPAPTNVTLTAAPTSVTLQWPPLDGVSSYDVERQLAPTTGWTTVASARAPVVKDSRRAATLPLSVTATDPAMDPDTPASYRVAARYADGRLGVSAPVAARTTKPSNPIKITSSVVNHVIGATITPNIFASASIASADVTLTWDAVAGATAYEVSGTQISVPRIVTTTSLTIPLVNAGFARYEVVAHFVNGVRHFTDPAHSTKTTVQIGSPPVANFGGLAYAGNGAPNVDFRWTDNRGATDFRLLRADSEAGPYTEINASAADQWRRDRSTTRGKTYFYKLMSLFQPVASPTPSNPSRVTVTAVALTPAFRVDVPLAVELSNLRATSSQPRTVVLTWTPPPGATEINILRGVGNDYLDWIRWPGFTVPMALPGQATSYTDSNLWNGGTYRYTVCAKIPNGSACATASTTVMP